VSEGRRPSTARSGRPEPVEGRRLLTAAYAAAGAALFVYVVRRAGVAEIVAGIREVGWGLAAILALAGARFILRAACWRLCMPPHARLPFDGTLAAFLAGDAVGNVTPLGLLASEPTKIFLVRHHLATRDSVASLALENLIYAVSVGLVVMAGLLVVLATVPMPGVWQAAFVAALVATAGGGVFAVRLLRGTWDDRQGRRPRWRERLAGVRLAVMGFSAEHMPRLWRALALDGLFHTLAILEIFLTLWWLSGRMPTLAQAIIFESLNRLVTIAFKFVPFRIGVDEALSGAAAPLLALNPAAGVTLAVVRKVRNLFWTGIGLAIIAAHPVRAGRPTGPGGNAPAPQP